MSRIKTQELHVNFGPQHPSMHGVLFLKVKLDGEVMTNIDPVLGYLHRSMEKIFENRTYAQGIAIIDRSDYLSAYFNEYAYILPIEKLMDIDVPERAQYLRVLMMELNRIASHIFFYGTFGIDIGATTPILYSFREREKLMDLFELVSGYRMHPNYFRVGGVKEDVPEEFLEGTVKFCDELNGWLEEYHSLLSGNEIFHMRSRGVGKITTEQAINLGITGPLLRSTGFKWDIRKDDPYSIYDRFDFDIPTGKRGDVYDAYWLRFAEVEQSLKIIRQVLSKLPDGPVKAKVPLNVRPPKGEAYARIESPRGELAVYLVSDGSDKPYRAKVRAPSFVNLQLVPDMMKGQMIADCIALLAIIDPVMGEVDR
jgi:NADH-quinone oxidoreductase subunit D